MTHWRRGRSNELRHPDAWEPLPDPATEQYEFEARCDAVDAALMRQRSLWIALGISSLVFGPITACLIWWAGHSK